MEASERAFEVRVNTIWEMILDSPTFNIIIIHSAMPLCHTIAIALFRFSRCPFPFLLARLHFHSGVAAQPPKKWYSWSGDSAPPSFLEPNDNDNQRHRHTHTHTHFPFSFEFRFVLSLLHSLLLFIALTLKCHEQLRAELALMSNVGTNYNSPLTNEMWKSRVNKKTRTTTSSAAMK